jgi:hypothetical protein
MFVQVIEGKVKDADLLLRQTDRWTAEIKPDVQGYLGSTGGVTPDGRAVWVARFESAEAAQANSHNPRQDAWWNETAKAFDGEPTFYDCTDVDTLLDGGSDAAGFVQVIEGKAKDPAQMKTWITSRQDELRTARPDIIGGIVAWHGDGFSQIMYFTDEAQTRQQEQATEGDDLRSEFMDAFAAPPVFYDIPHPRFDAA